LQNLKKTALPLNLNKFYKTNSKDGLGNLSVFFCVFCVKEIKNGKNIPKALDGNANKS
jgi:hypothetical protein